MSRGSVQMAGGLLLVGAAGYYLLAVSGQGLSAEGATAVASVYLLANIIGPGLSTAMEQETCRAVSHALARGCDPAPVIRRMTRLCAGMMGAATAVLLALSPILVPGALDGQWGLFAALALSVFSFGSVHLVRGILGGYQLFGGYAVTLAVEGFSRLLPLFVLHLTGVAHTVLFGLIFAAGSGFGALAGLPWLRRAVAPSAAGETPPRLGRSFGILLGSSFLMQTLANLAPVLAAARLTSAPEIAAVLASGFVLARIPLFLFLPVQATLLPRLVHAVTHNETATARRLVTLVLAGVGAVGAVGILATWAAGDWVLSTFFGARISLAGWALPALAAGTVLMMVMQVLQPTLLALHKHAGLLPAWALGTVVMVGTVSLPLPPLSAVVIGQLAGSAAAVACAAWQVTLAGRKRRVVAAAPLAEPARA